MYNICVILLVVKVCNCFHNQAFYFIEECLQVLTGFHRFLKLLTVSNIHNITVRGGVKKKVVLLDGKFFCLESPDTEK